MDKEELSPIVVTGSIAIIDNTLDGDLLLNENESRNLIRNFHNTYYNKNMPLVLEHTTVIVGTVDNMYMSNNSCDVRCVIDDRVFLESLQWMRNRFYNSETKKGRERRTLNEFLQSIFPAFSLGHFNETLMPIHVALVGVGGRRQTLIKSLESVNNKPLRKRNNLNRDHFIVELANCMYKHKQTLGREFFLLYDAEKSNISTDFTCANLQSTRSNLKMTDNSKNSTNIPMEHGSVSLSISSLMELIDKTQERIQTHKNTNADVSNMPNVHITSNSNRRGERINSNTEQFPHRSQYTDKQGFDRTRTNIDSAYGTQCMQFPQHQLPIMPIVIPQHNNQPNNSLTNEFIQHFIDNKFKEREVSLDEKINNFSKSMEKNIRDDKKSENVTNTIDITRSLMDKLNSLEEKMEFISNVHVTQPLPSDVHGTTMASMTPKKRTHDEVECNGLTNDDASKSKKAMNSRSISPQYISELISDNVEQK